LRKLLNAQKLIESFTISLEMLLTPNELKQERTVQANTIIGSAFNELLDVFLQIISQQNSEQTILEKP
jgi:hypothetical protein